MLLPLQSSTFQSTAPASVSDPKEFKPGDTVRLVGGNPAHVMTVRAASPFTVLCAAVGPGGKVQYEPYAAEDLELVTPADQGPPP